MVKESKFKRIIIGFIIICLISGLLPIGKTKAYATTEDDIVIYQDGVEYVFTLDDDMNIIIEAETDAGNQAAACIEQDGDFEFETTSKEGDVLFSGTINELTAQTIDAEVKTMMDKSSQHILI